MPSSLRGTLILCFIKKEEKKHWQTMILYPWQDASIPISEILECEKNDRNMFISIK